MKTTTTGSKIVECKGETWQAALDERNAFIASVRAAGGRAKAAKNEAGFYGKPLYAMTRDYYRSNTVSCYVAWARVA